MSRAFGRWNPAKYVAGLWQRMAMGITREPVEELAQKLAALGRDVPAYLDDQLGAVSDEVTALAAVVDALALNYGYAATVGSHSTTSTSYVDITNTGFTITTSGGPLLIILAGGSVSNDDAIEESYFGVKVDSTDYPLTDYQNNSIDTNDIYVPVAGVKVITGLAAGAHTVIARFKTSSGGAARVSGDSQLAVFAIELTL